MKNIWIAVRVIGWTVYGLLGNDAARAKATDRSNELLRERS